MPIKKPIVMEIVDPEMASILASKTEAERLQIAWGMWRSARRMLTNIIVDQHRDWSAQQVEMEVSRRIASGA